VARGSVEITNGRARRTAQARRDGWSGRPVAPAHECLHKDEVDESVGGGLDGLLSAELRTHGAPLADDLSSQFSEKTLVSAPLLCRRPGRTFQQKW
jgi:hypothetical protein